MLSVTKTYADRAYETSMPAANLRVVADDMEVKLFGSFDRLSRLSNWAFDVLSSRARAPADYLRTLPAPTAAACLNHALEQARKGPGKSLSLLFHELDGLAASRRSRIFRAVTPACFAR
jgi:hypothetical protein